MATRYTDKKKQEVVKFVENYDQKNGRGGQAAAKKKYGINPISIKKWCVEQGLKSPGKSAKKVKKTVAKSAPAKRGPKPGSKRGPKAKTKGRPAKKAPAKRGRKPGRPAAAKASNGSDSARLTALEKEIKALQTKFARLKKSL